MPTQNPAEAARQTARTALAALTPDARAFLEALHTEYFPPHPAARPTASTDVRRPRQGREDMLRHGIALFGKEKPRCTSCEQDGQRAGTEKR
jgi:hypothetical protein